MASHYVEESSEMLRNLIGPEFVEASNIKNFILETYKSIKNLRNQANQAGNWRAKADLSMAYRDGIPDLDVEKDFQIALGWLESSIQNGNSNPTEILNLGTMYDLKGTPLYHRKAYEMYMKAARLGSVQAELNLAEIYRCGIEGVVQEDLEEAFRWYRRAVDEETADLDEAISVEAKYMRGTLRRLGIDTKIRALTQLHENYMNGDCPEGKPQPQKALYYLKKAAILGHIQSQKELGLAYLTGVQDVPKDLEEAKRWLEKAASHGNIEAKEVLERFHHQSVVEGAVACDAEADKQKIESSMKQYLDLLKVKLDNKMHPFVIENPLVFQESMFTQFPNSPTAQNYLKAFRRARKGLDKLQEGSFKEAIKLMALSYLYENTVLQTFPEVKLTGFRPSVIVGIFAELKVNESFFEGLLVLVALYVTPKEASTINFGSFKIDLKKTMFLNNLIFLIENYESADQLPKANPYDFEMDYSSWLHVAYYFLGSLYTMAESYDEGAHAFEKALKCCPSYYEAKVGLAYCLMSISFKAKDQRKERKTASHYPKGLQDTGGTCNYETQKVPTNSYLRWTSDDLKQKAKKLFLEYLEEAPVCDKKYPNCCYHLAFLHFADDNIQEARKWKKKGEDAEEKRLPFMGPVSANSKDLLIGLDMFPIPNKAEQTRECSYKGCPSKPTDQLKPCPCQKAFYCGRECQKKDWKEHKKTCSKKVSSKEK